jgi:hypothetical protein
MTTTPSSHRHHDDTAGHRETKLLDALGGRHTVVMRDDQDALAKLDRFITRLEELRDLAVNGVIDAELAYRASQDRTGLACCWCGYDLTEHDDEAGHREVAIPHAFRAAGTKSIAWLLDVPGPREPFAHDHARTPDLEGICVRCRIEARATHVPARS